MKERKVTVNLTWANIFATILMVVLVLVSAILWLIIWGKPESFSPLSSLIFFGAFFLSIVVHELIHGMTWAHYTPEGWKSISFGIIWKMLTPYCHCDKPLKVRHYIIGALMPLFILGFAPLFIGFSLGLGWFVVYGVLMTCSAGGDILVAWKLRNEPAENTVLDHPTEAGCIVYEGM